MKDQIAKPGIGYDALIALLRSAETVWNSSRVFFARWDLSPSQFNVLNLLHDQTDGCSQIELSRLLITHRSNVTGLVDRLEARGLVRRRDNLADRRAFIVVLTPNGKRLVDEIHPHYYRAAETLWEDIPEPRLRQLVGELNDVSTRAERIATAATP